MSGMTADQIPGSHRARLRAVAVIVPAHDEQEWLGTCLDALAAAAWRARKGGIRVLTLVVADACTDATRAIARSRRVGCVTVTGHNVGAARAAGTGRALSMLAADGCDPGQIYLLHTDADSAVPPNWITEHLRAAEESEADAVLGPVEVHDWSMRAAGTAQRYAAACAREPRTDRVHGANLGVRADAYLRVGGFQPLAVAEDRMLVQALRAVGASILFRPELAVSTSARLSHRLNGGFSDLLGRLEASGDRPGTPQAA